jgi:hypothetical protein
MSGIAGKNAMSIAAATAKRIPSQKLYCLSTLEPRISKTETVIQWPD